jgi:oligosaccharide translocation protein RFT1
MNILHDRNSSKDQNSLNVRTAPFQAPAAMSASPFLGSASALILLQLLSRIFTFVLNQSLLAFVSPEAFGTASVQFELVSGTILFLCREGVRGAALRSNGSAQSKTNMSYLPFLAGMPMALIAAYVYSNTATRDTRDQPGFSIALSIYSFAAVVELLCEPFHNA